MTLTTLFLNALKRVSILKIIYHLPKINLNTYFLLISEKMVPIFSFILVLTYIHSFNCYILADIRKSYTSKIKELNLINFIGILTTITNLIRNVKPYIFIFHILEVCIYFPHKFKIV